MIFAVDRERVFTVTFFRSEGKADLTRRLNIFIRRLKNPNEDGDDMRKELEPNAPELISALLDHSDPDVQTLSVCCIIAILKVIKKSDEVPCRKDKVRIIEAVTSQIKKISTCDIRSEVGKRLDYILSSVGTIMWESVLFNSAVVPGVENLFPSFVDAIISAFKEEHADRGECLDAFMTMTILRVIHA